MIVRFRKKIVKLPPGCGSYEPKGQVYEWSPDGEHWYTIRRKQIQFTNEVQNLKYQLMNWFFNAIIAGIPVSVHGRYFRDRKEMEVEL